MAIVFRPSPATPAPPSVECSRPFLVFSPSLSLLSRKGRPVLADPGLYPAGPAAGRSQSPHTLRAGPACGGNVAAGGGQPSSCPAHEPYCGERSAYRCARCLCRSTVTGIGQHSPWHESTPASQAACSVGLFSLGALGPGLLCYYMLYHMLCYMIFIHAI